MNNNLDEQKYLGELAFILHAHLPYVKKNEKNSLEEDWFFQALLECYLPLLHVMEEASKDDPENAKLTLSLSPTLLSLLESKELKNKFPEWIETRIYFLSKLSIEKKIASEFLLKNIKKYFKFWDECSGDLINKFKLLSQKGCIDIITCAATHGYLPILRENPKTVTGQIKTAIRHHRNIFDSSPLGIWLPECAYYENLDTILSDCGIRYAVLDGHGILNAKPRPRYGVYAPICTKKGVAFFGRDSQATLPVWSSREGYPGDSDYREFHKDLGWEIPLSNLKEKGISTNRPLGLKFYKITDNSIPLAEKELYVESLAIKKAEEHAEKYLFQRTLQLKNLNISSKFKPILIAPFDAELFGHWWYEGPIFIRNLFKKSTQYSVKLTNLREILSKTPRIQICEPSPSSWGQGGYHNYWLNEKNSWIVPEITKAGLAFTSIISQVNKDELGLRVLKQAARELLLCQSSDWSFILRAGTTTELAKDRIEKHVKRFWQLIKILEDKSSIDIDFLNYIEEEDKIFSDINLEDWS